MEKKRLTDVADTEQLFRLIQSVPSPKAEPFKGWMGRLPVKRIDELQDPELTIDRAMWEYKRLGYSDSWINQTIKSIEIRKNPDGRMEALWNGRRGTVRRFDRYYHKDLV